MVVQSDTFVRAAKVADVESAERVVVTLGDQPVVLFWHEGKIFAVDNRCPHMGFPLHRGSLKDGILTCHWHHARFDLASGGTFDQFADDVACYPTQVRDDEVWVDVAPRVDPVGHQRVRLGEGLEHDINLVIAKASIVLVESSEAKDPFRIGLDFGTRHRAGGWSQGLTMHTCFMNLLPYMDAEDRPRALYQGLSAVARDCFEEPTRFQLRPLPNSKTDPDALKSWFRQFVEVRDEEGAERCIVSAVRAGAGHREMTDMLFAAATDHRYLRIGHVLDFTNKALESLDVAGWEHAEQVLSSLAREYARATRAEESNSWRHPIDLVELLEAGFDELPAATLEGKNNPQQWAMSDDFTRTLLGDDPASIVEALLAAIRSGATEKGLSSAVAYVAALRIARFHTSNEFGDWDTALHTFTFANAVNQGLSRNPSIELLRGVFDAAMSIYLDRFLNVPPARLPEPDSSKPDPAQLLSDLPAMLDVQQQVNQVGALVGKYLFSGGDPARLIATLCKLLLREDRDFHTLQTLEAAIKQFETFKGTPAGVHCLVAAARYMGAHFPTVRSQDQTYSIALRLARGQKVYEDS